jgi:hypothetical protein
MQAARQAEFRQAKIENIFLTSLSQGGDALLSRVDRALGAVRLWPTSAGASG